MVEWIPWWCLGMLWGIQWASSFNHSFQVYGIHPTVEIFSEINTSSDSIAAH
jgi:hypothetical protein